MGRGGGGVGGGQKLGDDEASVRAGRSSPRRQPGPLTSVRAGRSSPR